MVHWLYIFSEHIKLEQLNAYSTNIRLDIKVVQSCLIVHLLGYIGLYVAWQCI